MRFHGNVITVNRCVGIAWDNKRVSSETLITKGSLSSNGRRYIRGDWIQKSVSLGTTVIEVRSLSLIAAEDGASGIIIK
jgi:hypothetical protein